MQLVLRGGCCEVGDVKWLVCSRWCEVGEVQREDAAGYVQQSLHSARSQVYAGLLVFPTSFCVEYSYDCIPMVQTSSGEGQANLSKSNLNPSPSRWLLHS